MKRGKINVTFFPDNKRVQAEEGISALEAIQLAGLGVHSLCGGKGKCGKCKVRILDGAKPPVEAELEMLSEEEIDQGYRLACAFRLESDATILVPVESRCDEVAILQEGMQLYQYRVHSDVEKVPLNVDRPSLEDPSSDQERLERALKQEGVAPQSLDIHIMRELPERLRASGYSVVAVLHEGKLIAIENGDATLDSFGVAVDIGTTTVVGYLMCLKSGRLLATASRVNRQRTYGSDVISRAAAVIGKPDLLRELQALAVHVINQIIEQLISEARIDRGCIYKMAVVGNTCMLHLFLGISPKYLTLAPYTPVFTQPLKVSAGEVGININPNGLVETLPCIAGFVGADTTGVILSTLLNRSEKIKLAIDLGTNGEIVLGSRDGLLCCSAAAGPAFEGEHIGCGMIAAPGAIDRVVIRDDAYVHAIGGAPARGICGSGLVDAIAEMLKAGIIDEKGRMPGYEGGNSMIRKRFRNDGKGRRFVLSYGERKMSIPTVFISQNDVEELQLAKAAISAGVRILMKEGGISADDISEVFIAGAFGQYMRKESLFSLGVLPEVGMDRVKAVGNAAGEGAKIALLSGQYIEEVKEVARNTRYVELSAHPDFKRNFVRSMFFPARGIGEPRLEGRGDSDGGVVRPAG